MVGLVEMPLGFYEPNLTQRSSGGQHGAVVLHDMPSMDMCFPHGHGDQ